MKVARKVSVFGFSIRSQLFEPWFYYFGSLYGNQSGLKGTLTNKYGECHGQKNIWFRRGPHMIPLAPIDRHLVARYSDAPRLTRASLESKK